MVDNMIKKIQPARKTTSIITSVVAGLGLVLTAATLPAEAASFFEFEAQDAGGTGSATMEFEGLGTTNVTVLLDNTSPLTLDSGSGINAPAIPFFGFDGLGNDDPEVVSWTLTAEDASGNSVVLSDIDWSLEPINSRTGKAQRAGVRLDYLFTNPGNVQSSLYNPDAVDGLAAGPNYFTSATLEVVFDDVFNLDESSTFVRMQNVGSGGGGSLKIDGVPSTAPVDPTPDPDPVDPTPDPVDPTPPVVVLPPTGPGGGNSGPAKIPEPSMMAALGLLAAAGVFGVGKKQKKM